MINLFMDDMPPNDQKHTNSFYIIDDVDSIHEKMMSIDNRYGLVPDFDFLNDGLKNLKMFARLPNKNGKGSRQLRSWK